LVPIRLSLRFPQNLPTFCADEYTFENFWLMCVWVNKNHP
jgi:hypothetical protein